MPASSLRLTAQRALRAVALPPHTRFAAASHCAGSAIAARVAPVCSSAPAALSQPQRCISTTCLLRGQASSSSSSQLAGADGAAPAASADADSGADPQAPPPPVPLFLRMPPIDGVGRCKLQRWCVNEGEEFARGAVLCEIDSDLAVIEYKAQAGGILALRRTQVGEKIVDGQILGVQVGDVAECAGAPAWLAHVERMARREKREHDHLEALEEAENEVIEELERNTPEGQKSIKDQ